ncbi:unnamed protein product [Brachionus calyciflorus]|uniref:Uncharacterized protein n=1 Tax=Brachionus calyciflorus TaxID=104777 RepID=A0A813TVP4_9BILA|nr:unnamed protein product [Brachionus calyciflorus]
MFKRTKFIKNILFIALLVVSFYKFYQFLYDYIINSRNQAYLKQNSYKFKNNSKYLEFDSSDPLSDYVKKHEDIINLKIQAKIVFHKRRNSGGYGNSLYAFFSALLISILSDSALVSDWEYIDLFIKPPLKNIFHKYESNSQFNINYKSNYLIQNSPNAWIYNKNLNVYLGYQLPSDQKRLHFESITAFLFDLCANPKNYDKIAKYKLASNKTLQNALTSLSRREENNPHLDAKIVEDLLLVGYEVFSTLLNKFWIPQDFLQKQIDDFYLREFKGKFVVGMQLRFLYMDASDMDKFFKCAFYIEKINGVDNAKWFLSGDDDRKVELIKKKYPNKFIYGNGKIGHTSFSSIGSYERAVFDSGSTFGFTAAIRQNKLPYCIEGLSKQKLDENEPCKRMSLNRGPKRTKGFIVI